MQSDSMDVLSKALKDAVFSPGNNARPKEEVIKYLFKHAVSKLFEEAMVNTKATKNLQFEAVLNAKRGLINLFRSAELAEHQKSVEWYENLFDGTVKEILEFASARHTGEDLISLDNTREFSINPAKLSDIKPSDGSRIIKP